MPARRAATRLPSRPTARHQWGRWLVGAALVVVLASAAAWAGLGLTDAQSWPVRTLRIEGALQRVSDAQLKRTVQPHVSAGFWAVSLRDVREAVQALPWVADVSVRRVWPDGLAVQVREWVPVARWGNSGLMTAQGEVYEPQGELPADLPELAGPAGQADTVLGVYERLASVLRPAEMNVEALTLTPQGTWRARLDSGMELVLGKTDLEERVHRFLAAVPVLTGGDRAVARVDLRYTNGLAVRWAAAEASAPVGES